MGHVLAVQATPVPSGATDSERLVLWQVGGSAGRVSRGGEILVEFTRPVENADAMAELRALFQLLVVDEVCGERHRGNNMRIEVSSSQIRKALAKGAIQTGGRGRSREDEIGRNTEFLATRYFMADVKTGRKLRDAGDAPYLRTRLTCDGAIPRLRYPCSAIGEDVAISRHALFRAVGRIDQQRAGIEADDLRDVPGDRFKSMLTWLVKILNHEELYQAAVDPATRRGRRFAHQARVRYMVFNNGEVPAVLVLTKGVDGWAVRTVLNYREAAFLKRLSYADGQRVIGWRARGDRQAKYERLRA